ncbi:hypothetical protein A2U01_0095088, partial [Trifolium medium]|nr:hypothetical protein [Trifolium medium]
QEVLARHARLADEDGKVSGIEHRQEWRVAPVIKNRAQAGLGQLRAAQIHVTRRAPSCNGGSRTLSQGVQAFYFY